MSEPSPEAMQAARNIAETVFRIGAKHWTEPYTKEIGILIDAAFSQLRGHDDLLVKKLRLVHRAALLYRDGIPPIDVTGARVKADRLLSEAGEID